jgi:hypothetical protein
VARRTRPGVLHNSLAHIHGTFLALALAPAPAPARTAPSPHARRQYKCASKSRASRARVVLPALEIEALSGLAWPGCGNGSKQIRIQTHPAPARRSLPRAQLAQLRWLAVASSPLLASAQAAFSRARPLLDREPPPAATLRFPPHRRLRLTAVPTPRSSQHRAPAS